MMEDEKPDLRLLVAQPDAFSLMRYQRAFLEAALDRGWEVHVAVAPGPEHQLLAGMGIGVHPLEIPRGVGAILRNLKSLLQLRSLRRSIQPDVTVHVGMKSVFSGALAGVGLPGAVVSRVLGLGYSFTSDTTKARLIRMLLDRVLPSAFTGEDRLVVMENADDARVLVERGVTDRHSIKIIPCGTDTSVFTPLPLPPGPLTAAFLGRLIRDKGIFDIAAAARILRERGVDIRILVYGALDPANPSAASREEMENWVREGLVEYRGFTSDVRSVWQEAHLVLLPSYREGLPVSVIEAAACARSGLVSDVPGCRDAVIDEATGRYVAAGNPSALADALEDMAADMERLRRQGESAREHVVARFDSRRMAARLCDAIEELAARSRSVRSVPA